MKNNELLGVCQSLIGKVQLKLLIDEKIGEDEAKSVNPSQVRYNSSIYAVFSFIISLFSLIFNHFSQKSRSTSSGIIAANPLFSSISIFAKNVSEVDRLFPLSDGYFGRFFPVFHEKFSLRTKLYSREALFLATFRDFRPLRRLTDFFNMK